MKIRRLLALTLVVAVLLAPRRFTQLGVTGYWIGVGPLMVTVYRDPSVYAIQFALRY
jgi:hypothetical protein